MRPLLFVMYRIDQDVNVEASVTQSVDDTKMPGVTDSEEGCQSIQRDVDPVVLVVPQQEGCRGFEHADKVYQNAA